MKLKRFTYHTLIAITAFCFMRPEAHAQKLNYELVSMYVYNFTKYIEWPDDRTDVFVIGVYGISPVTSMLTKYITTKHVGMRPIIVKVITSSEDASGCSILFLPYDQSGKIKELSEQLRSKPVLIISEKYGLCKKGAAICIFLDEDDEEKTKFEINKESITDRGLNISSNLLKLASQVY
jgi:hypothetical protein